ncbi:MAG TPA: hypothetical protein DEA08_09690 [Planctomycetes bacterium]|nr:hypothetical protein [Planctomycetota bacterium]
MSLPRLVTLLAAALLLSGPASAKDKGPKKPEPTPEQRTEIRQLMRRAVGGRHEARRSEAATKLGRMGPVAEMAVPSLVQALKDRDVSVGCAAANALGRVGVYSKAAVKGLTATLSKGRDPLLRASAAEGLGMIGALARKPAARPLLSALTHKDQDLRREAAKALGLVSEGDEKLTKQAIKAIQPLLSDDEKRVRRAAALSLVRLGDTSPKLVDLLKATVTKSGRAIVEERRDASAALGKLGAAARSAVPTLIAAVREEAQINKAIPYAEQRRAQHDEFRRAAVVALGEIGDPRARAALERAKQTSALAEAAEAALAKLPPEGEGEEKSDSEGESDDD